MIKIKRLLKSFIYAFRGLRKVFKEEQNLRVQSIFAFFVICLGFYFHVSSTEWCFLILSIGLVILMEILNSAVERITDVLKPRLNTYVKEIKDIMAAAVLLSSFLSVFIGLIVFWHYFLV